MAIEITRKTDAAAWLVPEGWKWMTDTHAPSHYQDNYGGRIWEWGYIVNPHKVPGRTAGNVHTHADRQKLYSALCATLRKYQCESRVYQWARGPDFNEPAVCYIRPISRGAINSWGPDSYETYLANIHSEFNVLGWTTDAGDVIPPGEFMLNGKALACGICLRVVPNLVSGSNPGEYACRGCVRMCPGGTSPCNVAIFDKNFQGCAEHYPRENCASCAKECEITRMEEHKTVRYCRDCFVLMCERCEAVGKNNVQLRDGNNGYVVCPTCEPTVETWLNQARDEKLVLEKPGNMGLQVHTDRPVRLASIELEVTSGALDVLESLYQKGLTTQRGELAGHWRGDTANFCYMEADGSLPDGGGELIFSRLRLNDSDVAKKLSSAVGVMRRCVKNGDASVDMQTGAHIHVDAHKMGFNHIRNLVVLFNFLEDVIYRLSAANYTRHRGVHYAMLLPKANMDTQANFNRHFFSQNEHHSVLNVAGFYSAAAGCGCGNILNGDPNDCVCDLGKCTVEFRVFNGTSSWRKLHAYLALCMSMVAYARANENLLVTDFPPSYYNAVGIIDRDTKKMWADALSWMFKNLWFSEDERASLMYCVQHSELAHLGDAAVSRLKNIVYSGEKYQRPDGSEDKAPSPFDFKSPRRRNTFDALSFAPPFGRR